MNKTQNTKPAFLVIVLLMMSSLTFAQKENKYIRKGNNAYESGDYQKAEIDYRKALEKNKESVRGDFNLGGALYEQKSYEEATKKYERLTGEDIPADQKAASFHNLGNTKMGMQEYEQAIDAYKNALRLNPNDADSKYNLEYARQMLKQQEQQQEQQDQNQDKQDQEDKENKDQDKKQDQEQQDQQDQQEQDKEQKEDQKNSEQQDQQNSSQDKQQQQAQPKQISKEDAERMLQALKDNEKNTLEKIKLEKLKSAKKVKSEKDW